MAWDDCFTERDYDSYMGYDQPDQEPDDERDGQIIESKDFALEAEKGLA